MNRKGRSRSSIYPLHVWRNNDPGSEPMQWLTTSNKIKCWFLPHYDQKNAHYVGLKAGHLDISLLISSGRKRKREGNLLQGKWLLLNFITRVNDKPSMSYVEKLDIDRNKSVIALSPLRPTSGSYSKLATMQIITSRSWTMKKSAKVSSHQNEWLVINPNTKLQSLKS